MNDLAKCFLCQKTLNKPKTLSCLHSFCSGCIGQFIEDEVSYSDKPRCPVCQESLSLAHVDPWSQLKSNPFIESLVSRSLPTKPAHDADGEVCEKKNTAECQAAQHQFIEKVAVVANGNGTKRAACMCSEHGLEKISYCNDEGCEGPVCPMCAVKHVEGVKSELESGKQKASSKGAEISMAIEEVTSTLEELRANERKALQKLDIVMNEIIFEIENRKRMLCAELRDFFYLKEKDLLAQQKVLQSAQDGLSFTAKFTDKLLQEGSDVDIVLSKKDVMSRLETLISKEVETKVIHDASLEFDCEIDRLPFSESIAHFGHIKSSIINISCTRSRIEGFTKEAQLNVIVNKPFSFVIVAEDTDGKLVDNASHFFEVEITGPSERNIDLKGEGNGRYLATVTLGEAGQHQVKVKVKNQSIKNCPLNVMVNKKHYRDPKTFDEHNAKFTISSSPKAELNSPADVLANSQGEIIILNYNSNEVLFFTKDGEFIRKFGSEGSENGQFNNPLGLAVDEQDNIYVADYNNHRVQVFDPTGSHLRNIGTGFSGSGNGEFNGPAGICIDHRNGNILVADYSNHRIQVFNREGRFIRKFGGTQGRDKGQLCLPAGVAVNSIGEIVVSECGNHRLQIFNYLGRHLRFINNETGEGEFYLNNPWHICLDDQDNVYVGSTTKYPIDVINTLTNKHVHSFANKGYFDVARGLNFDPSSNTLYIADFGNNMVYAF